MNQKVTVSAVNVTPVEPTASENLQQTIHQTAKVIGDVINEFSDEVPGQGEEATAKEKKATTFLNDLKDFMKSEDFKKNVDEAAKKSGVPPKRIAQNFLTKALGTLGDILGIGINVIFGAGDMVIHVVSTVAHSILALLRSIANGIASVVTLNQTCNAHA